MSTFETLKYLYFGLLVVAPVLLVGFGLGSAAVKRRWTRHHSIAIALAALLFGTYVWASHIEPQWLQVRQVDIESDAVSRPLRIVHISDIQTPTVGAYEREVFETIASVEPDLVIHTGDVLQPVTPEELAKVARLFAGLEPTYGVYNVPGDVDDELSAPEWAAFDRQADVETLINETTTIETDAGTVRLLGLDGRESRTFPRARARRWLEQADHTATLDIIFGHAPDYMLNIRGEPVDLALAGHTHGGQVRIPFYGPPLTLSRVPRDWAWGHTIVDGTHLNVTSGVGAERAHGLPPIRFNCPPEITVIEVLSE